MAGSSEFDARIGELQRRVGVGKLVGRLYREGPYAAVQHERLDYRHETGGPKYQEGPLYANFSRYLQMIADGVLSPEGPERAMADAMENLNQLSAAAAPKETTALSKSGHVTVSSGGRVVIDRPPQASTSDNPARDRARQRRGR